jgi:hypothetical protein
MFSVNSMSNVWNECSKAAEDGKTGAVDKMRVSHAVHNTLQTTLVGGSGGGKRVWKGSLCAALNAAAV